MNSRPLRRVAIIGSTGSGKTTLAKRVAEALGLPRVELDALRHGPNWNETPDDEFARRVISTLAGDSWVVDGN